MSETLAVLSSMVMIAVIVIYFRQLIKGHSTPNPATWFIVVVVMALNTGTYYFVTQGNLWKIASPTVLTLGLLFVLVYSYITGKLGKLGVVEWLTLLLCVPVGIYWRISEDAKIANLMMQIILLVSFVPTVVGLLRGNLREKATSWMTALLAYFLLIGSVLSSATWEWMELAYPLINGIAGNSSVLVALWLKPKE